MATTSKSKRGVATTIKAPEAKATELVQPTQTQEVKAEHQFDNPDDLAHFIHHNPEFGTLPLDEQGALRTELIRLKRAQAAE